MADVKGGETLSQKLADIVEKLRSASFVDVGFLPGATYPDGTPVAMVAALNEYGHVMMPPGSLSLSQRARKQLRKDQEGKGRVVPPRPFFREMISEESPHWGADIAALLKADDYKSSAALDKMGAVVKGELVQKIQTFEGAPLAPSTISRKGFSKALIDTAQMQNSVDYAVDGE